MPKRKYVGAMKSIITRLDGIEQTVERDETVEVSAEQADELDRQPENWKKVGGRTSAPPEEEKEGD